MGGFVHVLGEIAEKVLPKAIPDVAEHIEAGLYRGIFNPAKTFESHPYAAKIHSDYHNEYLPRVEKYTNQGIRSSAIPNPDVNAIQKVAKQQASDDVFGTNKIRIQAMLKNVAKVDRNKADVLSNHLNVMFEESAPAKGYNKGKSKFDLEMGKGKADGFDTPVSPYKPQHPVEKGLRMLRKGLAFKAAAIHGATTALNVLNEDGLVNLSKSMYDIWGPGRQATIARIQATDAISEINISPLKEAEAFRAGIISKFAPGSVGEFVHRNMFIPGMSLVRRESLYMGANTGRLMAEEAAGHLKAGNDKWAVPALRSLGLDPVKIKSQQFKIAPDDLEKAYYHGANNRIFLHPYDSTPTFWRQSPLWRSIKAFSGFVAKQVEFEKRVITKQFQQGDFAAIARNVALKSLAFPLVGSLLYETDRIIMGSDHDDPLKHYKNRLEATPTGALWDAANGKHDGPGAAQITINSLDMIARLGVLGNTFGYMRGADRANLLSRVVPPEVNMGVQGVQDLDKALHTDVNHPNAADPLGRDILSDIPFTLGIGSNLSHELLPTKKERDANKYHRYKRTKQKKQSNNPLNNDWTY